MTRRPIGPGTRLVHSRQQRLGTPEPLTTPIYETSTFVFENAAEVEAFNAGRSDKYLYSRYANPTVVSVEQTLASLDGAERALVFSSGMAATSTLLLTHLAAGDEVVCCASIYGGTRRLLEDLLARFGVGVRFATVEALADPAAIIGPATRLVWFETPTNPTLRCVDIRRVAEACRARGVLAVLDNTFATPLNQQAFPLGVDLVMQSATKNLNGHSDVTAGAVCGPAALVDPMARTRSLLGTVLDPMPAYALGRGLKTLGVRMARQNASARTVAEFLEADSRVSAVFYPGLTSHPDHAVAARQMSGFGGMVCFDLDGRLDRAVACFDRLGLIARAASLGGVESLVSLPVLTSHTGFSDEQLREAGVTKGMLRLSVGLEDADDLIADLDQALG